MPSEFPNANSAVVLVVDDDLGIRSLAQKVLEKNNFRVLVANDGREALAIWTEQMHSIDLILTDMAMPHLGGVALVRAIRKTNTDIPIIASTGRGDSNRATELQALGVNHFLAKPYTTEDLVIAVRKALQV
jgi:CheY-like chemotaxis protein